VTDSFSLLFGTSRGQDRKLNAALARQLSSELEKGQYERTIDCLQADCTSVRALALVDELHVYLFSQLFSDYRTGGERFLDMLIGNKALTVIEKTITHNRTGRSMSFLHLQERPEELRGQPLTGKTACGLSAQGMHVASRDTWQKLTGQEGAGSCCTVCSQEAARYWETKQEAYLPQELHDAVMQQCASQTKRSFIKGIRQCLPEAELVRGLEPTFRKALLTQTAQWMSKHPKSCELVMYDDGAHILPRTEAARFFELNKTLSKQGVRPRDLLDSDDWHKLLSRRLPSSPYGKRKQSHYRRRLQLDLLILLNDKTSC
jgi:hypothetical protein